jgi:predicted histone-like DNA-binding protein
VALLIIKTPISMAITIKPSLRKNPQDKAAAAKYYAQVVLAPEMTQRQIVEQIADRCTLTGSDIKAVLDALMTVIKRNLANGSPVRLGDLGSFRPSVSGFGSATADKCGASSVKKARVIYVPSTEIKEAVSMYAFSKAGANGASGDGEAPDPDDGGGEAPDPGE